MTQELLQLMRLPLDSVIPNPKQPRKEFDLEKLWELARSIESQGLQQAIKVRPTEGGKFEIVMGERRWRAHALLERPTIDCVVEEMDDLRMAQLALLENLTRVDLNVAETGQNLRVMLDAGSTWEAICASTGFERQYLEWKLDVVEKCIDQVVWLVKQGTLTGNMGWRLTKLSANGQMQFLRTVNERPMTQHEQIGAIDAIWMQENQPDLPLFEETKLTPEQVDAGKSFAMMLDRAILLAERVEKMETKKRGTLAAALATELDVTVQKVGYLEKRLASVRRSLQRKQGELAIAKEGEAA